MVDEQVDAHRLAENAVRAARDGHDDAAQALAAAGLACVLQEVLHFPALKAASKAMADHGVEDTGISLLRIVAIELATSDALVYTDDHVEGFNRHGPRHGKVAFYGEGEMLAGLLLLVAWVRELSWCAEYEPDFFASES